MSVTVNLLSARRVAELRRRRRMRGWSLTVAAYALGLAGVWSGFAASMSTTSAAEDLANVQSKLDGLKAKREILAKDIKNLQSRASLVAAVSEHPDWSLLLTMIAGANGGEVGLERMTLSTRAGAASPAAKASDLPEHGPWSLTLTGASPTQRAASQFVTRLEALGIFETVSLTETRERAGDAVAGAGPLVDFTVVCTLSDTRPIRKGDRP